LQKFLRKFISEDGRVINNKQTNVSRVTLRQFHLSLRISRLHLFMWTRVHNWN